MLEPPYQTYSSVGHPGFYHRFSAHEFIVSMGLAQARPNQAMHAVLLNLPSSTVVLQYVVIIIYCCIEP